MRDLRKFVTDHPHVNDDCVLLVVESEPTSGFDNSGFPIKSLAHDHGGSADPGDLGTVYLLAEGIEDPPLGLPRPGDIQIHQGKEYVTNEVGGINIATKEPIEKCPKCGEDCHADWVDNGFGPYAVQAGPFHCEQCGWIQGQDGEFHIPPDNLVEFL